MDRYRSVTIGVILWVSGIVCSLSIFSGFYSIARMLGVLVIGNHSYSGVQANMLIFSPELVQRGAHALEDEANRHSIPPSIIADYHVGTRADAFSAEVIANYGKSAVIRNPQLQFLMTGVVEYAGYYERDGRKMYRFQYSFRRLHGN